MDNPENKKILHYEFSVDPECQDQRLDHYLVEKLVGTSRTRIQKLLKDGYITVNDSVVRANYRVQAGDHIKAMLLEAHAFKLIPEDIPLNIVYEDKYLLVIDKPVGMVVHPAVGHWTGTLLNGLLYYLQKQNGGQLKGHPGLVHRLDKDTSGLLLAAKDEDTLKFMQLELKERRVKREYQALVWGHLKEEQGRIDLPIGRNPSDRKKMCVTEKNSRSAVTKYSLETRYKFSDHLRINLQTGRTHQIRVHFSHLGHPVVGDREYGGDENILSGLFDLYRTQARNIIEAIPRQALHASKLQFNHPVRKLMQIVKSELPEDIRSIITYLQKIDRVM